MHVLTWIKKLNASGNPGSKLFKQPPFFYPYWNEGKTQEGKEGAGFDFILSPNLQI